MKMVKNTCLVKRAGSGEEELDITELVPGDIVFLAAGDMIPADCASSNPRTCSSARLP